MKKSLLLPLLLITTTPSFAEELHNFTDVRLASLTGKSIHIAVDFSKCSPSQKESVRPTSVGIFTPNEIQVGDDALTTSFSHFTLNSPSYPNKPIYEFVKYTLTNDNSLNLSYQLLDARNFSLLAEQISFNCKMDTGVKIYS